MSREQSDFWAVASFYNPQHSHHRVEAYYQFRDALTVPLLLVELSADGQYDLTEHDAEIVIRCNSSDVMFHKERLLNIGVSHLPTHCDFVAWLDCDILFERDDWTDLARRELESHMVVQVFERLFDLQQGESIAECPREIPSGYSFAHHLDAFGSEKTMNHLFPTRLQQGPLTGLGWVSTREFLLQYPLYDVLIMGGGVRAQVGAYYGWYDYAQRYLHLNSAQMRHYLKWAKPVYEAVQGRVGYIPNTLFHIWHGSPGFRRKSKFIDFQVYGFDPATDLSLTREQTLCWSSDKPELHRFVADGFQMLSGSKGQYGV